MLQAKNYNNGSDRVFSLFLTITPPKQPESSPVAPKADKGKEIVTKDAKSPKKLLYYLINDEIQARLDKEEKIKKAVEEAKLLAMTKSKLIKVIHEEASKAGIDPKVLESTKGGQDFQNIQDVEMKVLNREHSQNVKKVIEVKKKRIDNYMRTISGKDCTLRHTPLPEHPNSESLMPLLDWLMMDELEWRRLSEGVNSSFEL
ncbi:hypothetical protein Tco_1563371 [Tanacetum coccineum]